MLTDTGSVDAGALRELRAAAGLTCNELLRAAMLISDTDSGESERLKAAARRLDRSVLRPLGAAVGESYAENEAPAARPPTLWELARQATELCAAPCAISELLEATGALQDLACAFAPPSGERGTEERPELLRALMRELPAGIRVQRDGPYLVTNAEHLRDWLGCSLQGTAADGPVPLRAVGDQALLRRQPRQGWVLG